MWWKLLKPSGQQVNFELCSWVQCWLSGKQQWKSVLDFAWNLSSTIVLRDVHVYIMKIGRHTEHLQVIGLRDIFQWKLITRTRLQLSAVAKCPPHTFIYHSLNILHQLMTVFMYWVDCVTNEVKCVCTLLWTGFMFTLCTPSSIAPSRTICRGGIVLHQTFRGIETVWSVKINH